MPIINDALLATIDSVRGIADTVAGLRLYDIQVYIRTYAGRPGNHGTTFTEVSYPLTVANGNARPKVTLAKQASVVLSGSMLDDEDLIVGPLTPPYQGSTNNTDPSYWNPPPDTTGKVIAVRFLVTGDNDLQSGAWFKLLSYDLSRATRLMLTLRKTSEQWPQ